MKMWKHTFIDVGVPFQELRMGDSGYNLNIITAIPVRNLVETVAVLSQTWLGGLMVTGRRGRGGSLSSLGRAGGRHDGRGLSGVGSCGSLSGIIIICLTRDTILSSVIEFGAVQIRIDGLELLGCYAPAVDKGLTSVSRTGSYCEGAVDTTTRKGMSDGACSNQL
jgi:hypothetical protein